MVKSLVCLADTCTGESAEVEVVCVYRCAEQGRVEEESDDFVVGYHLRRVSGKEGRKEE